MSRQRRRKERTRGHWWSEALELFIDILSLPFRVIAVILRGIE